MTKDIIAEKVQGVLLKNNQRLKVYYRASKLVIYSHSYWSTEVGNYQNCSQNRQKKNLY